MRNRRKDRIIYAILISVCVVGFWLFDNFYTPASYSSDDSESEVTELPDFFIPTTTSGVIVKHRHYQLSYKERYEQSEWVAYSLNKNQLTYDDRERPDFIEDPYVKSKSADWRNYRGSGYDRGHLCPAGDRRFSELAYRETFYTSNISPQDKDFNAGPWNDLEKQVRLWAKKYGEVYVVTGGVLHPTLPTIGDEDVAVPEKFYKIVAKKDDSEIDMVAFLLPQTAEHRDLRAYLVTVDEIEEQTGIDFFKELPDSIETKLEKETSVSDWSFRAIR